MPKIDSTRSAIILNEWFLLHLDKPSPDKQELERLCALTNKKPSCIYSIYSNKRRSIKEKFAKVNESCCDTEELKRTPVTKSLKIKKMFDIYSPDNNDLSSISSTDLVTINNSISASQILERQLDEEEELVANQWTEAINNLVTSWKIHKQDDEKVKK